MSNTRETVPIIPFITEARYWRFPWLNHYEIPRGDSFASALLRALCEATFLLVVE